jgi:signal transduction histidine kinase/CheY-like chemotaxis protein
MVPTTDREESPRPSRRNRVVAAIEWIAARIARIRAPLSAKLQSAFLVVILLLLATAVVSMSAIARIGEHTAELSRLDSTEAQAQRLDSSILAEETVLARTQEARQRVLTRILTEQRENRWKVSGLFVLSISLAVGLSLVLARTIIHPIRTVDAALQRIAAGEFTSVVGIANRDELGSLVMHMNRMSQQFNELYARERQATRELESVRQARAQVVQAEKLHALGEMAGGVAHNFNNRLSVVLGQAEHMRTQLARNELTPAEMDRRLQMIERAALDGAETVRRLLDFTRVTPRSDEMHPVDVSELFTSVVAVAEPRWKEADTDGGRPIEVVTECAGGATILGKPAELWEVLLNLLFNALEAMPQGGRLTLASRIDGDRICLEVKDTGVGMSAEIASRIFEPFFTTKGPQRRGLGLSVSYGIVRRHGGDLAVQSRPGEGTTFTITLPVRTVLSREASAAGSAPSPEPAGLRVLVVDDDYLVRETLADLCRSAGHHVSEAGSGHEALDFLANHPVDLVCTDLGMPGLTGLELAPRIRRDWPAVKIALVTGWGVQLDPAQLRAEAVDFLITKPFRVEHILSVFAEVDSYPLRRASARAVAGWPPVAVGR